MKHPPSSAQGTIGGGASDSVAKQVAVEGAASVPPADADEWLAGTTLVLGFIREWLRARPLTRPATPAAFVFPAYPTRVQQQLGAAKVRGFKYAASTHAIQGNLYVGAETLNDVGEIVGVAPDVPSVFQYLVTQGMGEAPAVVVLPATEEAILCPAGVANEDACTKLSLRAETRGVTVASLDDMLDRFYRAWLVVPSDHTHVWDDARRYIPTARTEKAIHDYLFPFLLTAFDDTHVVRSEDRTFAGRADITIMKRENVPSHGSGVLELKVLRTMRYPERGGAATSCPASVNEHAVADGITQALSYRRKLGCELALVCLYDFRRDDDDSIVDMFKKSFEDNDVLPRRYFIYNSARAYRRAQPGAVTRPVRRRGRTAAGPQIVSASGARPAKVAEPTAKRPRRKRRDSK